MSKGFLYVGMTNLANQLNPRGKAASCLPIKRIESAILFIRGHKVMLERDLAALYGVTTFNLNKAVKRNTDRLPEDFMFQLTAEEASALRFQIGMSKGRGLGKEIRFPVSSGFRGDSGTHGATGAEKTKDRISGEGTNSAVRKRIELSFRLQGCSFRRFENLETWTFRQERGVTRFGPTIDYGHAAKPTSSRPMTREYGPLILQKFACQSRAISLKRQANFMGGSYLKGRMARCLSYCVI